MVSIMDMATVLPRQNRDFFTMFHVNHGDTVPQHPHVEEGVMIIVRMQKNRVGSLTTKRMGWGKGKKEFPAHTTTGRVGNHLITIRLQESNRFVVTMKKLVLFVLPCPRHHQGIFLTLLYPTK
eukprot:PhF_6_TR34146/c1_g1_i1/m.49877